MQNDEGEKMEQQVIDKVNAVGTGVENKFVLLTGAYGGMGKAMIKSFVDAGYIVIATDLNVEKAENGAVIPMELDITNDENIAQVFEKVSALTDKLYAIVNLAGILVMDSLLEVDEATFRKVMDVNFWGGLKITRKFFPLLKKDYSKVINITSEVVKYPCMHFNSLYTVSKKAFDAVSDGLRREMGLLGIKVIKVRSGSFKTNMLNVAAESHAELVKNTKLYKKELTKMTNMMSRELNKENDPKLIADLVAKILNSKKTKHTYEIKISRASKFIGSLPMGMADKLLQKVFSSEEK